MLDTDSWLCPSQSNRSRDHQKELKEMTTESCSGATLLKKQSTELIIHKTKPLGTKCSRPQTLLEFQFIPNIDLKS